MATLRCECCDDEFEEVCYLCGRTLEADEAGYQAETDTDEGPLPITLCGPCYIQVDMDQAVERAEDARGRG